MRGNKKYSLYVGKFRLNNTKSKLKKVKRNYFLATLKKKKQLKKDPLPKFINWLRRQINSGNKRFALSSQDLILYKPSIANTKIINTKLIFILPEVFDRYYKYSKISAKLIQFELKESLMITFAYTIVREGNVIEVFPCKLLDLPEH